MKEVEWERGRSWPELEGRYFVIQEPEWFRMLTIPEASAVLRGRLERVAQASKSWWLKVNFDERGTLLGEIDGSGFAKLGHEWELEQEGIIHRAEFRSILGELMDEYGAREPVLQQHDFGQFDHEFELRTYPTKEPGLVFRSLVDLRKSTGEIWYVWWDAGVVVPGTIVTEGEKEKIGKRQIRLKPQEQPTVFIDVTGFWWNYEGLARVSAEVARRLLDEFSQVDEGDKELLVTGFEEEIKHRHEYPCELVINQETGLALWFDETLLNFGIFQDSKTGKLMLHKPKFEQPKVIEPPIEIENFPYLSIVRTGDAQTKKRVNEAIRHIARMTTGFERRRFAKIPGVLEFAKEPFLQGKGPIELEIPILSLKST